MSDSVEQFKQKLTAIKEISTLPQVMVRIMEIITDESSCASDLASEIANDTSLTAKILKMVNSAYYGFYREIVKVSDAVVVLGFNEIRRLSLAISVLDMFGTGNRAEHRLRLWNHSFGCAAMSDIIAKDWGIFDRGAFTAGLLHDIGKAVLDQYFPSMFSAVQDCMRERSLRAHEAEKLLFDFDHADVGYWLSERWNLPVNLSEAIHCHHRPESAEHTPELAKLVHLADGLVNEFMELKAAGVPLTDVVAEESEEFPSEKKAALLLQLERRMKDSAAANSFL